MVKFTQIRKGSQPDSALLESIGTIQTIESKVMKRRPQEVTSTIFKPTIVAAFVVQSLAAFPAHSATIQPNVSLDSRKFLEIEFCSLREAIESMNTGVLAPGCSNTGAAFGVSDQILYSSSVSLSLGSELSITSGNPLTINLSGSTIGPQNSPPTHRIFNIDSANVTLNNATLTNGYSGDMGGAIHATGSTLTLNNSELSGNSVHPSYGHGGALYIKDSNVTINNSIISNNTGGRTGAIYARSSSFQVTNSTIANNGTGGGVANNLLSSSTHISNSTISDHSSAIVLSQVEGSLTLDHVTITANNDLGIASFYFIGAASSTIISNSVLSDGSSKPVCEFDGGAESIVDAGGNWFEDDSCNGVASGDPKLGPLADNGGPTLTQLPALNSPLQNFTNVNCAAADQRGQPRNAASCAPGAAEFISMQILVDSNLDDGTGCTLREAIASTNSASLATGCSIANPGFTINDGQAIYFDPALAGETITLGGSHLDVATGQNVMIDASQIGGMTIDGNNASRVLDIADSAVSLNNLTIKNGQISDFNGDLDGGAGIRANNSSLRLYESTVSNCTAGANSTDKKGGGISSIDGSLVLESSTVAYNHAASPGGAMHLRNSSFDIINSTISNNSTYANVGASAIAVLFSQPSSIVHSTVSNDIFALKGASGQKISIQNSVINSVCELVDDAFMDDGGNWFTDLSCNAAAKGDPGLLPLADNGGPTKTRALKESSGARDDGLTSFCAITDQRGKVRNEGDGKCDSGAFELLNSDIPVNFYTIPLPNGKAVVIPL